ncbi:hypothetical protein GEV33_014128 [Tenebrio molitor]|uniref:Reverse transcriptase domain-containing protein n=1 Tax=Tenebrio molitor TaxID=7067 RepID=A0A8J6H5W7_TENMO|nr:hypothetical protein GEV33_014128 [Tenebrio molitor]
MSEDAEFVSSEIEESAALAVNELLPVKSRKKYDKAYQQFEDWCREKRKTQRLDIMEIEKFLREADNGTYLMMKVMLIIGISGACRREELTFLDVKNITDKGPYIIIQIPDTKTNVRREFTISPGNFEGAGLIFKSKKNSLDYHSEMNAETFEEWLQDKLLPALTEPSIIVLDNASYHSRLEEKKPTCAWRKAHLQTWLQNNNIHFSETDKKDTLLKLCRQNYKSPVYVVDRVIHEAGHKPLRLPPYHCIFNPIEMVWSQTKQTYDSEVLKNKNPILAWRTALEGVSAEQWTHYIGHTNKIIRQYFEKEVYTSVEELVINVDIESDDSDSDLSFNLEGNGQEREGMPKSPKVRKESSKREKEEGMTFEEGTNPFRKSSSTSRSPSRREEGNKSKKMDNEMKTIIREIRGDTREEEKRELRKELAAMREEMRGREEKWQAEDADWMKRMKMIEEKMAQREKKERKNNVIITGIGGTYRGVSSLVCYYQNVRGLGTKTHNFYLSTIAASHYNIIALTETWLHEGISDSELFDLSTFTVFRHDRITVPEGPRRGGGVLLAVRNEFNAERCEVVCDVLSRTDLLLVKINFNYRAVYVLVLYIPPNSYGLTFADHFSKSFTRDAASTLPSASLPYDNLTLRRVSDDDVLKAIKCLKPNMTSGPDEIPSLVIRNCAAVFADPLCFLFNLILNTSCYPMRWKTSTVRPIHKKDDRSEITNYRPIALISNFAKVFEYVLYNSSLHYVSHKLSPNQHGFTKCRSTETNLASISQYLSDALDNHSQVDVVYTDLSKAFDRIDHGLLLIKLESFGFSDNLVELIRSYLSDRFMYVGVNGYASKPFKQESGVPQGSVLGPLFFNIFINDLVDDLDVPHLLFADDMKIYLTIDSIDDALRLQGCIEEISRRCKLNNLVLNHLKCSIVSFTRKTKPLLFDYKINGSILTRRESIRDLGVIFDSKLSFGEHIRTIAGTAFRALGFVLRAGREFSDVATLKLLYITYVRSRLEYASLVWSPIYDVHSSLLERVQRRFLKNVVFMLNGAYPPRGCPQGLLLGEVGLQSLLDRRMEHSVIFLFKLFRGLQECPHVLGRISLRVPVGI